MGITFETRREAYEAALPKMGSMEDKVLSILMEYGPQTAEEIMDRMQTRNANNVRPRLTGLMKKGFVKATGKKMNCSGRNVAIWEAVERAGIQ